MQILFSEKAFEQFNDWIVDDKKIYKKIVNLIKEISREPFSGIGKPEPLKYELTGCWSRRIDDEHRLVYQIEDEKNKIVSYLISLLKYENKYIKNYYNKQTS